MNEQAEPQDEPLRVLPLVPPIRNPAFRRAFIKGWDACGVGVSREGNPYPDWRTDRGGATFSRAFGHYWSRGWDERERQEHQRSKP